MLSSSSGSNAISSFCTWASMRSHSSPPNVPELVPSGAVESVVARVARQCSQQRPQRPHRRMLAGQMRADRLVADRIEIGEQLRLLEGEMPLDVRPELSGEFVEKLRDAALVRGRGAALARDQLLEPLHQRDGRLMLLVERLTDAVAEAHCALPNVCEPAGRRLKRAAARISPANPLGSRSSPDWAC